MPTSGSVVLDTNIAIAFLSDDRRADRNSSESVPDTFYASPFLLWQRCYNSVIGPGGSASMPVLSTFYGIVVSMYFMDNRRHHRPHVHARYQDDEAVLSIPESELLER